MKILIIEDEKAAVKNLTALLEEVAPNAEVCGVTDSIHDTLAWLKHNPVPDLVFMDIHLADGSSFEIFEQTDIKCPIIFTTAYDEYSLKAFRVNSIDYLLKPIGEKDIRRALDKLTLLKSSRTEDSGNEQLMRFIKTMTGERKYKSHFLIPGKGDKLIPLAISSVLFFRIEEGLVKAVTKDFENILFPHTLDELAESLDPQVFFRINRQYLISRDAIRDIELWFHGRLSISLNSKDTEKIIVSKARVGDFKKWFSGE